MFTTEIRTHFHYSISLLSVLTPKWLEKRRFTFYHTRKLSLKNFSFLSGNLLLLHSLYFLHSGLWRYMFHFVINCCLNTYHFMSRRKISEAYLYVWLPGKLFWEQQLLQFFFLQKNNKQNSFDLWGESAQITDEVNEDSAFMVCLMWLIQVSQNC